MTTKQSATMPTENKSAEQINLRKRIGSTTFEVAVHFSGTSQETLEDKLLRIIEREVSKTA